MRIRLPSLSAMVMIAIVCLGCTLLSLWFGWRLAEFREYGARETSDSRFAQIRIGLLNYHQEYGTFPPSRYQANPGGPSHSWRVLLLPYDTGTRELYSDYDFSQEWDSPDNLAVALAMPMAFQRYSLTGNEVTNYLAMGDGDKWPSQKPLRALLVTAGSDRFLLVENPDSSILWTEPKY